MVKEINLKLAKGISVIVLSAFVTFFALSMFSNNFSIQNMGSYNNLLTGFAILESQVSSSISETDLLGNEALNNYDGMIMNSCRAAHYRASDCFYLMKSIMSVTSEGVEDFSVDGKYGLVPMSPSSDMTSSDLIVPENNLRYAARHIMRLYDVYRGDLAFTAIAYYAGRALSNSIMYEFQRDSSAIESGITRGVMFSLLDIVYDPISESVGDEMPTLEDIKQFYTDLVFAYVIWTGRPVAEASSSSVVFDIGTYSVRPSFSAELNYNLKEILKVKEIIEGFIEIHDFESDVSPYSSLFRYIEDEHDGQLSEHRYNFDNPEIYIATRDLLWRPVSCTPEISTFERFIQRFIECLSSEDIECHCNFEDIFFMEEGYAINLNVVGDGSLLQKKHVEFQLINTEYDFVVQEYVHPISLDMYYGRDFEFRRTRTDFANFFQFWDRDDTRHINDFKLERNGPSAQFSIPGLIDVPLQTKLMKVFNEEHNRDVLFFVRQQSFDFKNECTTQQQFEKICVQSNNSRVYNPNLRRHTLLEYNFLLGINPQELEDEIQKVDVEELEQLSVEVNEKTITINPLQSCTQNNLCTDKRIIGKPVSYDNKRENIIVLSLEQNSNAEARDEFVSLLNSERTFSDWIDERHKSVHYLIDENGRIMKLAREDAVLQFLRCFDGNSVYIGLTGSENKYSDAQLESLLKLSYEIKMRTDVPTPYTYEFFRENQNTRRPDGFPDEYECRSPSIYNLQNEEFRTGFLTGLTSILRQHNNLESSD